MPPKEDRKARWNSYYRSSSFNPDGYRDWVSPHFRDMPPAPAVLELGCGFGFLSERLSARGCRVTATDISSEALAALRARAPEISTELVDITFPLPFPDDVFDVVVADLCLHYFDWETTRRILIEVQRVLRVDGIFAVRVNSSRDYNHGAGEGNEIEHGFFERNGHFKRFFDDKMIRTLFSEWHLISRSNYDTEQYGVPKNVHEVILRVQSAQKHD